MITAERIISKKGKERIVAITAYNYLFASIVDETGVVDIVLVGDSMNQVIYGERTTNTIPLDVMIWAARSVRKAVKNAMVIFDMPFGTTYPESEAVKNVVRIVKETDVDGVKIEGGGEFANVVKSIVSIGIPVMGHIGLLPQSVRISGYKRQGKDDVSKAKLFSDAISLQSAGAFSLVLESVEEDVAEEITKGVKIPTIGIGSGKMCDGEIVVLEDIIGLSRNPPKFVKKYDNLYERIFYAVKKYSEDVRGVVVGGEVKEVMEVGR